MNKPVDLPVRDFDDEDSNTSSNPTFKSILSARLNRRSILRGGVGGATGALFASVGLAACGGSDDDDDPETLLGFGAVAKSLEDKMTVPAGYTASVLIAVGDPIAAGVAAFRNDGTDTGYDRRAGDNHDGMEYFGLSAGGAPDPTGSDRGLLATNHEYINQLFLHVNGPTPSPRPASETDIEVDCHGVSFVEIAKSGGKFAYVQNSAFNRRVTAATEIEFAGPARGHPAAGDQVLADRNEDARHGQQLRHRQDALGHRAHRRGELGRLLLPRRRRPGPAHARRRTRALVRYGSVATATAAAASRYGWETSGADDKYARWNTSVTSAALGAADDYRNEVNGQGYCTEIDPYNPAALVKKRTALGRMAHESAAFSKPVVGKPLAVYMGDDARNEYIYKFVSTATWVAADATATDRIANGRQIPRRRQALRRQVQCRRQRRVDRARHHDAGDRRLRGLCLRRRRRRGDTSAHRRRCGRRDQDGPSRVVRRAPDHRRDLFHPHQQQQPAPRRRHRLAAQPRRRQSARLHRHPRRGDGAVRQSERPHHPHQGDRRRAGGDDLRLGHLPVRRRDAARPPASSISPA